MYKSNRNKNYILAIDLGTSGLKSAFISPQGEIEGWEFQKISLKLLPHGGAEQDPAEWWQALIKTTRRLVEKLPAQASRVIAINCTTQWSGTIPVNRSGQPLMNAVIWMDSRGAEIIRKISSGKINIQGYGIKKLLLWLFKTGGIPGHAGKDSISHILYIKEQHPEIYRETYRFLEPKDYINMKLTGNFFASYDSITLHWVTDNRDIGNITYCEKLLGIAGIDREKLPELKKPLETAGELKKEAAEEMGLKQGIKVIIGTPDMHSASIGSGAVRDYEGHLYVGTSSWIICHVPFKKTDIFHNIATLPSAIPGRYFVANEQETSGACLDFLKNIIICKGEHSNNTGDIYTLFEKMAQKAPVGSGGLIFTPWLYGERTPVENKNLRSCFFNISLNTTTEQLVRSVYEGVAFNTKWLLKYVERFIKKKFIYLNIIGGGADSDIWCQILADVLNRTIRQVEQPRLANLRGVALLASLSLDFITLEEISKQARIKNVFEPDSENSRIYDKLFREFLNIYRKNKKNLERLNKE